MTAELNSWISVSAVLVMILIALYQRKNTVSDRIWRKLEEKVDKEGCVSFRTRIGTESDEHRKNIECVKQDISEIKAGIAYLKGRYSGNV